MSDQWVKSANIVHAQTRETVKQEYAGVTVRMATITCPCGLQRSALMMYRCLYCKVFFCDTCAEQHFGKTVAEYRAEKGGADNE